MRFSWSALLLVLALAGGSGTARAEIRPAPTDRPQLLLMLRSAPSHYRPDAAYANAYQAPGRIARRALARRLASAQGLTLHEDWAMPVLGIDCFVLDATDGAAAVRALAALARDRRVESVQAMRQFRVLATPPGAMAVADPLYAAQPAAIRWHLAELHRRVTGAGVRVAVVDTGVAVTHPDLRGQIAAARDFVTRGRPVAEMHGTEVAGVIAAREGNGIGIAGIAPQARLLALRACWQRSSVLSECNSFTLAKALQFAIEGRAQVLNLSLSGAPDPLLARLIDAAQKQGIVVVAAIDPHLPAGGFPASHPGVLAATDLPRVPLASATPAFWIPGTAIPAPTPDGGWTFVDGASFSAAQLTGLVALIRERAPQLGALQIGGILVAAPAVATRGPGPAPAIDACAVLARANGACVCNCTIVSATMGRPHR